jgi:hypothetical protein
MSNGTTMIEVVKVTTYPHPVADLNHEKLRSETCNVSTRNTPILSQLQGTVYHTQSTTPKQTDSSMAESKRRCQTMGHTMGQTTAQHEHFGPNRVRIVSESCPNRREIDRGARNSKPKTCIINSKPSALSIGNQNVH